MIDVYVCHANCDKEQGELITKILESNNIHCWHDVNFQISEQWKDRLVQIINRCAVIVAYITEDALQSELYQEEVARIIDSGRDVIPVCQSDFSIYSIPPRLMGLSVKKWYLLDENHSWKDFAKYVANIVFPHPLDNTLDIYMPRKSQYDQLSHYLLDKTNVDKVIVVLSGRAGSGKTTLITRWLRDHDKDFLHKYHLPYWGLHAERNVEEIITQLPDLPYEIKKVPSADASFFEGDPIENGFFDEIESIKWDKDILIVLDDVDTDNPTLLETFLQKTGNASVVLVTQNTPDGINKYPIISLDSDEEFIISLAKNYFPLEPNIDNDVWEENIKRISQLCKSTPIFVPLLSKIKDSTGKQLTELLDDLEKGIAIKFDVYVLGTSNDSQLVQAISDELENSGYNVINEYRNLNILSYLGNTNNLPRFSEKMVIICSEAGMKREAWKLDLLEKLQVAVVNGVEIYLVGNNQQLLDSFYEIMQINVLGKFIEIVSDEEDLAQTIASRLDDLKNKRDLILHADQYWIYGNYQDAVECYTKALLIAENDNDVLEMITLYHNLGMLYGELQNHDLALAYAKKADELSHKRNYYVQIVSEKYDEVKQKHDALQFQTSENDKTGLIVVDAEDRYKELHDRIADYCNAAIELFQEMIRQNQTAEGLNCIKVSYTRLMSYCKTVGGMEEFVKLCIQQLEDVEKSFKKQKDFFVDTSQAQKINKSYRTYLGLESLEMDSYDVFISYKSQDQLIAQRVYDYLTSYGKKVFFSCASLPEMGRDEYTDAIFEAMDKSKHMALVTSDIQYVKSGWVKDEWEYFLGEIREDRKDGNVMLVVHDDMSLDKKTFPPQLRHKEIVKMSEFREKLLGYLH